MIQTKSEILKEICNMVGHDDFVEAERVRVKFLLDVRDALVKGQQISELRNDIKTVLKLQLEMPMSKEEVKDAIESTIR